MVQVSAPPELDTQPSPDDLAPRAPWHRTVIIAGLAVTLLLVGAIAGLLFTLPGQTPAPPTADSVDVGFAQDMSVHHQQAVEMASWERDHTSDPKLKLLASDIEATQEGQVGQMQGWLELWGAPVLPVGGYMAWMAAAPAHDGMAAMGGTGGPVATMPGMATDDELRAFRATTGTQLDVTFLQLMIRHHVGGSSMLTYAAQRAEVAQVRNLASQMLSSQASEVEYMKQLLAARGGTLLPS
ncbi:DUF305 domain-containing protein [Pseudonocardia sp. GCM10023141]|uniref:DUF305 domain-containing protein n=1 Tax=Pseudonocardia sp. GCM10023141 TaxID=3252653 RepID=UPI0036094B6C